MANTHCCSGKELLCISFPCIEDVGYIFLKLKLAKISIQWNYLDLHYVVLQLSGSHWKQTLTKLFLKHILLQKKMDWIKTKSNFNFIEGRTLINEPPCEIRNKDYELFLNWQILLNNLSMFRLKITWVICWARWGKRRRTERGRRRRRSSQHSPLIPTHSKTWTCSKVRKFM